MIKHILPIQDVNLRGLQEALEVQLPFDANLSTEVLEGSTIVYLYAPDDTRDEQLSLADTIALSHDPNILTSAELSERARQEWSGSAVTSEQSWILINTFNDGPEADVKSFLDNDGTSATLDRDTPLNQTYTHWRAIFDALGDDMKIQVMWHGYMLSHTFEFLPEPETPSAEYKAWFNNACAQVMGYITDRAQM